MDFPERVFTEEEVRKARQLIEKGYKHSLKVEGSEEFREKVQEALRLVKTAGYHDFLRTYIKKIVEIDGFSQLREADATIWANKEAVEDLIDVASLFIQKAQQMKDYLEGELYFDKGEIRGVKKRIEFLETLKSKSKNRAIKKRCEEFLERWAHVPFP